MCRIIRENDPPTPSRRLSTLGEAVTTEVSRHRQAQPEALRRQLEVARFDQLRQRIAPLAEARGWLTDEDVFDDVS